MALPQMTEEQRAAALEKAKIARAKRSEWIASIKSGETTLEDALATEDATLKKTRVAQVLKALPGVGARGVENAFEAIGIDEKRRVGGLGSKQKEALIKRFG